MTRGSITVIIGPMFAGKTSELIRIGERFSFAKKKYIFVKHGRDNRFTGSKDHVVSHNQSKATAVSKEVLEVEEEYEKYDVILIDEGQFFKGLAKFCDHYADKGKTVVVSVLNATFEKKPWEEVSTLIPLAKEIVSKTAICQVCGDEAEFSHRKEKNEDLIDIGGSEKYEARCRKCWK